MSAASPPAPRLSGAIAASVLFHAAVVAAFVFLLHPTAGPPEPPMYQVRIIAAPAGERAAGVVQDQPQTPPVETPAPVAQPKTPPPKPTVAKPKPTTVKTKPVPKAATPAPPTAKPEPAKPQPTAGGGAIGGKGTDVTNVDTPGIEFPYPPYTNNIVSQLVRRFGQMSGTLTASVRFVIRRDGSVDPESIRIVTSSGNYSFDTRALGAVESAANAKAFGPLPPGFSEDILPVTFRFSPSLIR